MSEVVQINRNSKIAETDFRDLIVRLSEIKNQRLSKPQVPIENLSAKVSNNIITASSVPIPDCLACGACCAFQLCITVKPTDHAPQNYYWQITKENKFGEVVVDQFMQRRTSENACAALNGELGESVSCEIYQERPQVCREFEAGSDKCHAIRRAYGIESPLTNEKALEANFRIELFKSCSNLTEKLLYSEFVPHPETEDILIVAVMENGLRQPLHIYNPNQETWLQAEFAGLTIAEAFGLIKSRSVKDNGS